MHRRPAVPANGTTNGTSHHGTNMNGHATNGHAGNGTSTSSAKKLRISLRRSGDIERDKYRLKQIYDAVSDPRGRDHFFIKLVSETRTAELSFPNDGCTINDKLLNELTKHFRVEVTVEEPMKG